MSTRGGKHDERGGGLRIVDDRRVRARLPVAVLIGAAIAVLLAAGVVLFMQQNRQVAAEPQSRPPEQHAALHWSERSSGGADVAPAANSHPSGVAKPPAPHSSQSASGESADQDLGQMAEEFVQQMRDNGDTRGLAAFPPHGTDPIKIGIVVPENFELPAGYVRYYQTTDDGQRLEAILMFSPDYPWVDAAGKPLVLPEDGVVPAEMAPPGLPLRTLELPPAARVDR